MNTAKVYMDIAGNDCNIQQIVKREPVRAAVRVQVGEEALVLLEMIKAWDRDRFYADGRHPHPLVLRQRIEDANRYAHAD